MRQELKVCGEDMVLTTNYRTEPYEEENRKDLKASGKGWIRGAGGEAVSRRVASIPLLDAMMLENQKDPDWAEFQGTGDRAAFQRLLARFPYWKVAEGGV